MSILEDIRAFVPGCEQEQRDREAMLEFLAVHEDAFLRTNLTAHMTASAWVLSRDRRRVVMVYHNLYRSWSWTGGHADGGRDLLAVAMREVTEETGLQRLTPVTEGIFSLECLTVDGHEKRGQYVPSHIHMNVTYRWRRRTMPSGKSPTRTAAWHGSRRRRRWRPPRSRGWCSGSTGSWQTVRRRT